jgi:DNA replication protein DnaC
MGDIFMSDLMQQLKLLCEKAKLQPFYRALETQEASSEVIELGFVERACALVEAQVGSNHISKVTRLRKSAQLRWPQASLCDFSEVTKLPVKFAKLKDIAQCNWIRDFRHIVITGKTGAGKTHLACSLAQEAILQEYSVLYYHYPALVRDLKIADKAGDDQLTKLRKKLGKVNILIIDDWGIQQLTSIERHLLFEMIEMRDQNGSLIITSQYSPTDWYDAFVDKTVADSTLDRIIPYSIILDWDRDSFRDEIGRQLSNKSKKVRGNTK